MRYVEDKNKWRRVIIVVEISVFQIFLVYLTQLIYVLCGYGHIFV